MKLFVGLKIGSIVVCIVLLFSGTAMSVGALGKISGAGGPMMGATVKVYNLFGNLLASSTTDAQGSYNLTSLPNDFFILRVFPPLDAMDRFQGEYFDNKGFFEEANWIYPNNLDLTLDMDLSATSSQNALTGQVFDSSSGTGIPFIRVFAYSESAGTSYMAETDEAGNYVFSSLPAADDYVVKVWFSTPDYSDEFYASTGTNFILPVQIAISSTGVQEGFDIDVAQDQGSQIQGVVRDADGKGVAGAVVSAFFSHGGDFSKTAQTGLDGGYIIQRLAPVAVGGYTVSVYHELYVYDQKSSVTPGAAGVDFVPAKGYSLSGVLVDEANEPAVGVEATLGSADIFTTVQTNAQGQFLFSDLPRGADYLLWFRVNNASYYLVAGTDNQLAQTDADAAFSMTANKDVGVVSMSKIDKGGVINGTVFYGGQPLAGGRVQAQEQNSGVASSVLTDAAGHYEITGLNEAKFYVLSLSVGGAVGYYSEEGGTFKLAMSRDQAAPVLPSDGVTRNWDIPQKGTIHGAVTLGGAALGSINVKIGKQGAASVSAIAKTVAALVDNSNYRIDLLPGNYVVSPGVSEGRTALPESRTIYVPEGAAVRADFVISDPLETFSVKGNIDNLKAEDMAAVSMSSESAMFSVLKKVPGTGGTVSYQIDGLPPAEDYQICFSSKLEPADRCYSQLIPINANIELTTLEMTYHNTIKGIVIFPPSAEPGQTATVIAVSHTSNFQNAQTIAGGPNAQIPYIITGCPDGIYQVSVQSDFQTKPAYQSNVQAVGNDPENIDFTLLDGFTVSGRVAKTNGGGAVGVRVTALANGRPAATTLSRSDGRYELNGLASGAYQISADHPLWGAFFYRPEETTKSVAKASIVSVETTDVSGIDIIIADGGIIRGIALGGDGETAGKVFVNAWSARRGAGNGMFADASGQFEIAGLPDANDYVVTAVPGGNSGYRIGKTQGVSPCTSSAGVDDCSGISIILPAMAQGATLSGTVVDSAGEAVSGSMTAIFNSNGAMASTTVVNGSYELTGLSDGEYQLKFIIGDGRYFETTTIIGLMAFDFTLPGHSVSGSVLMASGRPPDQFTAFLHSTQAMVDCSENPDGVFVCNNAPDDDHPLFLTVSSEDQTMTEPVVYPVGSNSVKINIEAAPRGGLSGVVLSETGVPLSGAVAAIAQANTDSIAQSARTNQAGQFSFDGLTKNAAYTITLSANGYQTLESEILTPSDKTFVLKRALSDAALTGTVLNDPALDNLFVYVNVYEANGPLAGWAEVGSDGGFIVSNLIPGAAYQAAFGAESDDGLEFFQWVNGNGQGVVNDVDIYQPTADAASFVPGDNIAFSFSTASPLKKSAGSLQVKDLRSVAGVRNLVRVAAGPVVTSKTVTISWAPTTTGADETYFYQFNQESDYRITKRNAQRPALRSRTVQSLMLTGDLDRYWAHVAAEDNRGRIGETAHLDFLVDNTAPLTPDIQARPAGPGARSRKVILELGAVNAQDMYISNIGYDAGGTWEPFDTEKEWDLPADRGTVTVYVRFRDGAGNVSETQADIKAAPHNPLDSAIVGLKILTGADDGLTTDDYDAAVGVNDGIIDLKDPIFHLRQAGN